MKNLTILLLLCSTILSIEASISQAQTDGPPAVRVETSEVIVPVYVIDKSDIRIGRNSVGEMYYNSQAKEITGLSAKDFHIFEDGKEQRVQNIAFEPRDVWIVGDNVSDHLEQTCTPRGIWSSPDLGSKAHSSFTNALHLYVVSYRPPPSTEGSCHQIKIKVDHRHATVYARGQYCNTQNALSDPMYGTKLGKQLEGFAESDILGKLPITVQVSPFFGGFGANRVDVTIEFPWSSVKRDWRDTNLVATVAVLGVIYDKNKGPVTRFSDMLCGSPQDFYQGPFPIPASLREEYELWGIPSRYETQIDLSSGEFDLKLVVTDGYKFGRVEVPLNIGDFNPNDLAISGIALCKRYHRVVNEPHRAVAAPRFVPIVSNGLEFTPAGDTRFKKGEPLVAYFEVYEPLVAGTGAAGVKFQMRITDVKTGELKTDTGLRPADSFVRAGNPVIPIAEQVAIEKLSSGTYRLEIQASDSAGKSTVSRATSFTVE